MVYQQPGRLAGMSIVALSMLQLGCGSDSRERNPADGGVFTGDTGVVADTGPADTGAPGDAGADTGVADTGVADTGMLRTIPDPGTEMADWGLSIGAVCCNSPETAYQNGVVTSNPGYVQGDIDASGDFFYVFRAGPALTELTWPDLGFDKVHIHDGTGLVFGPEVPKTAGADGTGTWTLIPDTIYVLELHSPFSGFF
jgi:hypothetical protein